jgi:hypothetical protein
VQHVKGFRVDRISENTYAIAVGFIVLQAEVHKPTNKKTVKETTP